MQNFFSRLFPYVRGRKLCTLFLVIRYPGLEKCIHIFPTLFLYTDVRKKICINISRPRYRVPKKHMHNFNMEHVRREGMLESSRGGNTRFRDLEYFGSQGEGKSIHFFLLLLHFFLRICSMTSIRVSFIHTVWLPVSSISEGTGLRKSVSVLL